MIWRAPLISSARMAEKECPSLRRNAAAAAGATAMAEFASNAFAATQICVSRAFPAAGRVIGGPDAASSGGAPPPPALAPQAESALCSAGPTPLAVHCFAGRQLPWVRPSSC